MTAIRGDFPRLPARTPVSDAIRTLLDAAQAPGASQPTVAVMDADNCFVGLFTLRNAIECLRAAASGNSDPTRTPVESWVVRDIPSARAGEPLTTLLAKTLSSHADAVPVLDDEGNLVGLVFQTDLFDLLAREALVAETEFRPDA
jgi:CBS-domain-containing membrane protein